MTVKQIRCKALRSGFSLPEVTLAVGVAAIGLVSLIGLVPSGLDSLRQSATQVAEAKIVQAVVADLQMSDWGTSSVQGVQNRDYYFDEKGVEVQSSDPWRHFTCRARVQKQGAESGGVRMSGDSSGNPYVFRVMMRITDRPNAEAELEKEESPLVREYGSLVALIEQKNS